MKNYKSSKIYSLKWNLVELYSCFGNKKRMLTCLTKEDSYIYYVMHEETSFLQLSRFLYMFVCH